MVSVDIGELVDFVTDQTGLDMETVLDVLEIEHEFMFGQGIVIGPEPEWRFFSPAEFGRFGNEVDPLFLAVIAEQRAGIPVDSALEVFDCELNFLIEKGVAVSSPTMDFPSDAIVKPIDQGRKE